LCIASNRMKRWYYQSQHRLPSCFQEFPNRKLQSVHLRPRIGSIRRFNMFPISITTTCKDKATNVVDELLMIHCDYIMGTLWSSTPPDKHNIPVNSCYFSAVAEIECQSYVFNLIRYCYSLLF